MRELATNRDRVRAMPQKLARTYGADEIVDFTSEDVVTRIPELTQGEGVDPAIEALGADVTFQTAAKVTKPGGTALVGLDGSIPWVCLPRFGPSRCSAARWMLHGAGIQRSRPTDRAVPVGYGHNAWIRSNVTGRGGSR